MTRTSTTIAAWLLLAAAAAPALAGGRLDRPLRRAWAARFFPGSYYDLHARPGFRRQVLTSWPSPQHLLELWNRPDLPDWTRVQILLGGAAFHDPVLLPAYVAAIGDASVRVRQAAAYGYRDLLGDAVPAIRGSIDDQSAQALRQEMVAMAASFRERPLVELWLDALLMNEGHRLSRPGLVVLKRSRSACTTALDLLVMPEDLPEVAAAFALAEDMENRIVLVRLLEGLTLQRFVVKPSGPRAPFIPRKVYARAIQTAGDWANARCRPDPARAVGEALRRAGARIGDPLGPAGCAAWRPILGGGFSAGWPVASRMLYRCGGPPLHVPVGGHESPAAKSARDAILNWYRPKAEKDAPPTRPAGTSSSSVTR